MLIDGRTSHIAIINKIIYFAIISISAYIMLAIALPELNIECINITIFILCALFVSMGCFEVVNIVNWLYGYTALNYDVLLQTMTTKQHYMTMYTFFSPYIRVFMGNNALTEFYDMAYHTSGLNGYNMSTMFGPMISVNE